MKFTLLDPQGFEHVLELGVAGWSGYENLAHGWEPVARQDVIETVLGAVMQNLTSAQVPLPYGFRYVTELKII